MLHSSWGLGVHSIPHAPLLPAEDDLGVPAPPIICYFALGFILRQLLVLVCCMRHVPTERQVLHGSLPQAACSASTALLLAPLSALHVAPPIAATHNRLEWIKLLLFCVLIYRHRLALSSHLQASNQSRLLKVTTWCRCCSTGVLVLVLRVSKECKGYHVQHWVVLLVAGITTITILINCTCFTLAYSADNVISSSEAVTWVQQTLA